MCLINIHACFLCKVICLMCLMCLMFCYNLSDQQKSLISRRGSRQSRALDDNEDDNKINATKSLENQDSFQDSIKDSRITSLRLGAVSKDVGYTGNSSLDRARSASYYRYR